MSLELLILWVAVFSIVLLSVMGSVAAHAGGASRIKGALRVGFWGSLAMGVTALIGQIFGVMV